ncbi:hypothetical protein J6Q66_03200 [bacterium]|nr:hypothetical protein [bacterium]
MSVLEDIQIYISQNKTKVLITLGVCLILIFCNVLFMFAMKSPKKTDDVSVNVNKSEFIVYDYEEQKLKYIEAKENQELEKVAAEEIKTNEIDENNLITQIPIQDNKVSFSVRTDGRPNPFAPYIERSLVGGGVFDIIDPPSYIPSEEVDSDLMHTTVSGILYNDEKSSAIINVDGTDQLVNKGDKIAGFQIVDISRTKVFVKKGYNIIAAGVGEAIEETPLTYNSVDNLPKKFGGKYDTPKKGVIVINGEQF